MKIIFANEEYNVPIVPQWEIYRYAPELHCTCGATEFRRNIVGLAEVKGAMMNCHECPSCGDKFRTHINIPHDDWYDRLGLVLHLHNQQFRIN